MNQSRYTKNMRRTTHSEFIFSPISKILKDSVAASEGIGSGIETYPLCDYVMQSIFIKMTGFQEQKLKCICWDAASFDYEYRYDFTKKPLGECSSYTDKNGIYKELIKLIKKNGVDLKEVFDDKEVVVRSAGKEIIETFDQTNLSIWAQAAFLDFREILRSIKGSHIVGNDDIFCSPDLRSWYSENLYRHRNRVAHNTSSYQQNLPTLKAIIDKKYRYENYFLYFFILVLMDKIYLELHGRLLRAINDHAD
jgi:hypothetical protein